VAELVAAVAEEYVPVAQDVHVEDPSASEYLPVPQVTHGVAAVVAPVVEEAVPAEHLVHSLLPST
jgi:hypothetical protein